MESSVFSSAESYELGNPHTTTSTSSFSDFQPTSHPVFSTTAPTAAPATGSNHGKPINYGGRGRAQLLDQTLLSAQPLRREHRHDDARRWPSAHCCRSSWPPSWLPDTTTLSFPPKQAGSQDRFHPALSILETG